MTSISFRFGGLLPPPVENLFCDDFRRWEIRFSPFDRRDRDVGCGLDCEDLWKVIVIHLFFCLQTVGQVKRLARPIGRFYSINDFFCLFKAVPLPLFFL